MTREVINNYLQMASGLTKTSRDRARAAAMAMLAQAGLDGVVADAGERGAKLAAEIMNAGRANRELLERVVAGEVDKATARLGFARASELESLRQEVAELRHAIADQQAAGNGAGATPASPKVKPARKTTRTAGTTRRASTGTATARKAAAAAAGKGTAPRKAAAPEPSADTAAPTSPGAGAAMSESTATGGEDLGG